jgi:aldehyde dehydrogenase (NAD+)
VAPDYILVPKEGQAKLVEALEKVYVFTSLQSIHPFRPHNLIPHPSYKEFYPDGALKSDSFSRIISPRHFQRLSRLLADTKGKVVVGGDTEEEKKYIGPTVVQDVKGDDSLMSE